MRKLFLFGAIVCALLIMNSCVVVDHNGFCDMYIQNESGHLVEFEVYDANGRNPETITLANGESKIIYSYVAMDNIFRVFSFRQIKHSIKTLNK